MRARIAGLIVATAVGLMVPAGAQATSTHKVAEQAVAKAHLTAVAPIPQAQAAACCPYTAGICNYADASPNWTRQAIYAIDCLKNRYSFWVNCCSSLRLVAKLSPNAVRFQQRYGLEPYADSDWDEGHMSGSICCWQPAGVKVTIRQ